MTYPIVLTPHMLSNSDIILFNETSAYLAPQDMASQDSECRVVAISAGASHTVALLSDDRVCAWGRGEDGQLGLGSAEEQLEPTEVAALAGKRVSALACGADHTTAYSEDSQTLWSWGWGDFGRLGHGHSSDVFLPHAVASLCGRPIKHIACGDCHCIAVDANGTAFSWGRNQNGQLGLGTLDDALLPTHITALAGVPLRMVAAGAEHTAAAAEDGRLYGWGWGRYGNLGLGDRLDRKLPEQVTAIESERIAQVACGWRHTIAVNEEGRLFTYGWSKYGQLGHGDFQDHLTPSPVPAMQDKRIVQVSGGWRHSVALDADGVVYAWGWNRFGQVGVGNSEDQCSPQRIESISERVVAVACGWRHTVVLSEGGNVYSWGRATSGQLGHGDTTDRNLPKRVEAISADGDRCRHISGPGGRKDAAAAAHAEVPDAAATWVSPAERYAVVPGEKVGGRGETR
ncbi:unnamed protein product [Closterium sp. Yama58-4]|nr:unnamed protein product [Closterium sp. Yama58-4]